MLQGRVWGRTRAWDGEAESMTGRCLDQILCSLSVSLIRSLKKKKKVLIEPAVLSHFAATTATRNSVQDFFFN